MRTVYHRRHLNLHEQEFIGGYCVSTVALGVKHHGGTWYETYIFRANGKEIENWIEVWGVRYQTRERAISGHADTCEKLRAGTLENFDGEQAAPKQDGEASKAAKGTGFC